MGSRFQEIIITIEASRARLLNAVSGLDQAALDRRPADGTWSVGEILHHLMLMETSVTRLLERQVTRAAQHGLLPDTSNASMLSSLDRFSIETAPEKIVAPQGFIPTHGLPRAELLDGLASSRAALLREAVRADSFDLAQLHFPHPVLGRLDMYQWVLYLGQHELRHLHQVERTR
jgi:DinB superfamily